MQTLRKKTSPLKYKNETSRFLGEGVSFKAKLIGILEVSEARGDRMCQEALSDLKVAIRAAGEHKQRITINIAIDGLRLRDEKNGDSLYHHPVHKISFIAQDMTDSRAFGYIFGSPDTGHRFFGIKTDKAASQVVIAMRDLFQVVFALKKKEIELAKQHLDKTHYAHSPFSENSASPSKLGKKIALQASPHISGQDSRKSDSKRTTSAEAKNNSSAVADLVDLELELNSLQQGLTQMERITPSDPFGSKDDPFGDSFTEYKNPRLLPPPPGRERSARHSESSKGNMGTPTLHEQSMSTSSEFSLKDSNVDWSKASISSDVFEEVLPTSSSTKGKHEILKQEILSQFDVFTDLDPLGTGKNKPYVDKKHFFQELKNPPKTVLNDLVSVTNKSIGISEIPISEKMTFTTDPFGDDPFKEDPFTEAQFIKDPFITDDLDIKLDNKISTNLDERKNSDLTRNYGMDTFLSTVLKSESPSNTISSVFAKQNTFNVDFSKFHPEPSQTENTLQLLSRAESIPDPPPRSTFNFTQIDPPPLPPKRQGQTFVKPPPRPPHDVQFSDRNNSDYAYPSSFHENGDGYKKPAENFDTKTVESPKGVQNKTVPSLGAVSFSLQYKTMESLNNAFKQLTLSNLNELAETLNVSTEELNNMTLAQLADFLTTVTKQKSHLSEEADFKADFSNKFVETSNRLNDSYDKYAVFRDILEEDLNQSQNTDLSNKSSGSGQEKIDDFEETLDNFEAKVCNQSQEDADKYAALRNIPQDDTCEINAVTTVDENVKEMVTKTESTFDANECFADVKELIKIEPPAVAKERSYKSPVPIALSETIQKSRCFTSGSLSDAASGSSPEMDNTNNLSEQDKENADYAGMSWAIFDSPKLISDENKEKVAIQSEEGASPWSSDSKEFGIGTPPEWKHSIDSSNGEDNLSKRHRRRKHGECWGSFEDPQSQYYGGPRSISNDGPCYDYHDRHHRCHVKCPPSPTPVDHSSSSREASPEEAAEEEDTRYPVNHRDSKQNWFRQGKYPVEKHRCRKYTDSWDEEDDYVYDEEQSNAYNWSEHRHYSRELDRSGINEPEKSWAKNWPDERKFRRRCEVEDCTKKCCSDWRLETEAKHDPHYFGGRFPASELGRRRYDKKHDSDAAWDEYHYNNSGGIYGTHKRNWKRPSSTSELEQKINPLRPRTHCGGSDGERERRFKTTRRSRSRDSQYSDTGYPKHRYGPSVTTGLPFKRQPHKAPFDVHMKPELGNKDKFDGFPPGKQEFVRSEKQTSLRRKPIERHENDEFVSKKSANIVLDRDVRLKTDVEKKAVVIEQAAKVDLMVENKPTQDRTQTPTCFEDDFTIDKISKLPERESIGMIAEESTNDEFSMEINSVGQMINSRKKNRNRNRTGNVTKFDVNLKKSESVNIFERENDPFDDDFFSENSSDILRSEFLKHDHSLVQSLDHKWSKFDDT